VEFGLVSVVKTESCRSSLIRFLAVATREIGKYRLHFLPGIDIKSRDKVLDAGLMSR
jgi:hypothetical protein